MIELITFALLFTSIIVWTVGSTLRDKRISVWARFAVASAGLVFTSGLWGIVAWAWHLFRVLTSPTWIQN